ncbi:hypothetical protein AKJ41_04260 [candidate division MSBL1 archaeon SCGC-AAA259O05]|uniref:Rad50/SbcC-type AAA domain-containing protein n=1 Tax=candidate division MSBL1 archaeon SCGC-AAA259O05 TaxID=1698271 RepID=A0A133V190_9EURY|nr:hypothetical protein AKJ41_04260 [candidate division MSBL1 archaeon SCGC-AAA259O05]
MRMKEINISRYGPIRDINWTPGGEIQPIYGPNESGETLLVEAMTRIFGGEDISLPEGVERVTEKPEGYIIVEMNGEEEKISFDNPLCEHLSVDPDELNNTLVVRNSDLRIESEDQFYERVSDKLSGLWTDGIRRVEEELKKLGRLTDTLKLSNKKGFDKAKDQLRDAKELRKNVKDYLEEAEKEGISKLEAQKLSAESKTNKLEKREEKLKLGKLLEAHKSASDALTRLTNLPSENLTEELGVKIETSRDLLENKPKFERDLDLFRNLSITTGIGASIAFTGLLIVGAQAALSAVIPGVLLLATAGSVFKYLSANSSLSDVENNLKELTSKAKKAGIELEEEKTEIIDELKGKIQDIGQERENLNRKLSENIGILKDNLELDADLDDDDDEILSGASDILDKRKSELNLEGDVSYDEDERKKVEKELKAAEKSLEEAEKNLEKHREKLRKISEKASDLDFDHFLGEDLNLEIDNLESLNIFVRKLNKFIKQIESDKKDSETAVEIFRELESEEEEKISDLFGEDSETSEIFEEITDGRYVSVNYDQEEGEIYVEKPTGEVRYPSNELCGSRGTVDQLYLSIRISLARKILGDNTFFVLDDALVFSDNARTKKQHEILDRFSKMGCQILYFTSTESVAENLSELSENQLIELSRLP